MFESGIENVRRPIGSLCVNVRECGWAQAGRENQAEK